MIVRRRSFDRWSSRVATMSHPLLIGENAARGPGSGQHLPRLVELLSLQVDGAQAGIGEAPPLQVLGYKLVQQDRAPLQAIQRVSDPHAQPQVVIGPQPAEDAVEEPAS